MELKTSTQALERLELSMGIEAVASPPPGTQRWIIFHQDLAHESRELTAV